MKLQHLHLQEYFPSPEQPVSVLHNTSHKSYMAHDHDFFEIVLIESGQAAHRSAEGEGVLRAGDILVIRPGVWHEYLEHSIFSVFNCMFSRDLFDRELEWALNDPVLYPIFLGGDPSHRLFLTQLSKEDLVACTRCMNQLVRLNNSPPSQRLQQVGLLLQIMGIISQARSHASRNIPMAKEKLHSSVVRAMHLIEGQIEHAWTLEEIAAALHINPSYLARLFKKGIGMPPLTYLAHCRDRRAADLLLASHLPIGEVSQKVGWDDPNYFARRFAKHFGKSPSEYRAEHVRG